MRINRGRTPEPPFRRLRSFKEGTTFQLKSRLSRDTEVSDPFLMVDMQSYVLYAGNGHECAARNKVVVLNLRNNRLSYIDADREGFIVDTEVCFV